MRHRARLSATAIALVALFSVGGAPTTVAAQVRTTSFGISLGVSSPMSGIVENSNTGYNFGGHVYMQPRRFDNLGLRGDVSVNNFGLDVSDGSGIRVVGFMLNAIYSVPTSGSLTPYVIAGIGRYNTKVSVVTGSTTLSASDSDFGYDAGAGVSFQLGALSSFVEARWVNIMSEPNGTSFAPISFGVRF